MLKSLQALRTNELNLAYLGNLYFQKQYYIANSPLRATTHDILNFYESISYAIKNVA